MKKTGPTPKAPQNRPRPLPEAVEATAQELAYRRAKRERKARRAQDAPMRRAFRGILPIRQSLRLMPEVRRLLAERRVEAGRAHREGRS